MKTCSLCQTEKSLDEFHANPQSKDKKDRRCKSCRKAQSASTYKENWFHSQVILKRSYCKKHNIVFDLDADYLASLYTGSCPITGQEFDRHDKKSDNCPHLDRVVPELGYTKGNVQYISARMNRIKYNATPEELQNLLKYMTNA